MRLTDLNPEWIGSGGTGVTYRGQPVPRREGVMLEFDCPCGRCKVPIAVYVHPALDGQPFDTGGAPQWQRVGESFESLTLTPSIRRLDNCGWHGFITNGEVRNA